MRVLTVARHVAVLRVPPGAIVALTPDLSVIADLLNTSQTTVRAVLKQLGQVSLTPSYSWMEKRLTRNKLLTVSSLAQMCQTPR
jgi:hypothetical protein